MSISRWQKLRVGDRVIARPKRYQGASVEVTVAKILTPTLADRNHFVGEDGETYTRFLYDISKPLGPDTNAVPER